MFLFLRKVCREKILGISPLAIRVLCSSSVCERATRTPTIGGFRNRFIVVRFLFVRRPHRRAVTAPPTRSPCAARPPSAVTAAGTVARCPIGDQSSGVCRAVRVLARRQCTRTSESARKIPPVVVAV